MAELGLSTTSSSDVVTEIVQEDEETMEPPTKKKCKALPEPVELEERLNGILCCTVCLDLPTVSMLQCMNGHLMCAGCHAHLIADSRLRDEAATCPNCRCDIRETSCVRNLAVEKALSELPTECMFCQTKLPRNRIEHHQSQECKARITGCRFERIGCTWRGAYNLLQTHEKDCECSGLTGSELIDTITAIDAKRYSEMTLFRNIFELLSFQKIAQSDPQLKPYRTDDFVTKLYYESARFAALGSQWAIKATISEDVKDPTVVSDRSIDYQLILKSRSTAPLDIHYLVLKGPNSNYKIKPTIYRHEFTSDSTEAPSRRLLVEDSIECNRILSHRAINLRVLMFQPHLEASDYCNSNSSSDISY